MMFILSISQDLTQKYNMNYFGVVERESLMRWM